MTHESNSTSYETPLQQVSVVINVWGGDDPSSLRRSLSSITDQSRRPNEVVVVIDGPISKELETEILSFQEQDVFLTKLIRIPTPNGLWNARNIGVKAASFELVALNDADDVMHPERLQIQIKEMKRLSADVCFTQVVEFNTKNEEIIGCRADRHEVVNARVIFWNNILSHSSAMFKRASVIEIGGYRNVYLSEDYDLWLRLVVAGKQVRQSKIVLQALGVNSGQLNRRGGLQFVKSENLIHRLIKDTGEFSSLGLLIRKIIRLTYRLGPKLIRQTHRRQLNRRKTIPFPKTLTDFLDSNPVNSGLHF